MARVTGGSASARETQRQQRRRARNEAARKNRMLYAWMRKSTASMWASKSNSAAGRSAAASSDPGGAAPCSTAGLETPRDGVRARWPALPRFGAFGASCALWRDGGACVEAACDAQRTHTRSAPVLLFSDGGGAHRVHTTSPHNLQ
eukprot:2775370-Pleurochrysis_carterae.AAC.1